MSSTNVLFHPGSLGPLRFVCTHMQPQCHCRNASPFGQGCLIQNPVREVRCLIDRGLQQIPPLRPLACQRVKWCDERRDCHPEREPDQRHGHLGGGWLASSSSQATKRSRPNVCGESAQPLIRHSFSSILTMILD